MAKQLKEIEIPFGAKDSELCGWEYTIPEGMEATIVDNKIVVKKKESEDKKIRKIITLCLEECVHKDIIRDYEKDKVLGWLEQNPTDEEMKELLHTEYEKGRADAIAEIQKGWSEEDEERLDSIIESYKDLLRDYKACHNADYIPYNSDTLIRKRVDDVNFLKSLKDRETWKPSDGQMKILDDVIRNPHLSTAEYNILKEVKRQLKKLREA